MPRTRSLRSVWRGPEKDGITFSLLSRFICCRERFRLLVIEGLRPAPSFNHRIEYGSMWHVCEEAYANSPGSQKWLENLRLYARRLCDKYRSQQTQVEHWYRVCKTQFPVYVEYWSQRDLEKRVPICQEKTFRIPYALPSGRVVTLRGKWDSVDIIGEGKGRGIYLQENKTKGDINEEQIKRQLYFDLQTMIYLVALHRGKDILGEDAKGLPVLGVRYNVVRRPLSGGKNSIRQTQNETQDEFYERLGRLIAQDPGYYFMRWRAEVTQADVDKFRRVSLDPILEQLWDWWEWFLNASRGEPSWHVHYRMPYGVYNVFLEGGSGDLDAYLDTGSELGLVRSTESLFPELDDE